MRTRGVSLGAAGAAGVFHMSLLEAQLCCKSSWCRNWQPCCAFDVCMGQLCCLECTHQPHTLSPTPLLTGSNYVLSGRVAADLAAMRDGSLRHFANEGERLSLRLMGLAELHETFKLTAGCNPITAHHLATISQQRQSTQPTNLDCFSLLSCCRRHHRQLAAGLQCHPLRRPPPV